MATTKSNFVLVPAGDLVGAAVGAYAAVRACGPDVAAELAASSSNTLLDKVTVDLAAAGLAKNGSAYIELAGSTAITLLLTNLATNALNTAGDTVFATWSILVLNNVGTHDLVISSATSNGATLPLAGTTPTLTVPAGTSVALVAGTTPVTVDSSHTGITITPTAGGKFALSVGGA